MKQILVVVVIFGLTVGFLSGCAGARYNMQKGAAVGAALGAGVGQLVGQNTAGTLIGAAIGTFIGALTGNAVDQNNQQQSQQVYADPQEQPPGQWVLQKGQWAGGKWIPSHKVWQPVNPSN